MGKSIDCEYTSEIVCPYCGEEVGDSWEFEGEDGEWECHECEKTFNWYRTVTVEYSTTGNCEKNKEDHDFTDWDLLQYSDEEHIDSEVIKDFYLRKCKKCDKTEYLRLKDFKEN